MEAARPGLDGPGEGKGGVEPAQAPRTQARQPNRQAQCRWRARARCRRGISGHVWSLSANRPGWQDGRFHVQKSDLTVKCGGASEQAGFSPKLSLLTTFYFLFPRLSFFWGVTTALMPTMSRFVFPWRRVPSTALHMEALPTSQTNWPPTELLNLNSSQHISFTIFCFSLKTPVILKT